MNRTWKWPSLFAWLLLLAGLALFVSAGRWQYGKAELKHAQLAAFDAVMQVEPTPLRVGIVDAPDGFDRVRVRGELLAQRYLLDNQVREGRVGIDVFAPLRSADGQVLLVALGWLAYDGAQRQLPILPDLDDTMLRAGDGWTGILAPPPSHGLRLGRDWHEQAGYPKLMPYFDLAEIAADLGVPVSARVLRLDSQQADSARAWQRDWRPAQGMPPERHLAYAWQWWSLAIAIVVVFVVVHFVRGNRS